MNTRRPLIAGNWKMHKTNTAAVEAAKNLRDIIGESAEVNVMIAPAFTALAPVSAAIQNSPIALGAQNLHWEPQGAFTGEIAANMLISAGCRYVIIGHSERRQYFNETDININRKLQAAFDSGLIPIFCIGETEQQRDNGQTFSVLDKQVKNGLEGFLLDDLSTLIVAYEPVWAIGTGKTATNEQVQEVHEHLRQWFTNSFSDDFAQKLRILYGGSVKPSNIKDLMAMPDVDGALVGGASLDPETFCQLVHF